MELKDFISNTLYEICMGIGDAKRRVHEELNNHPISPGMLAGKIAQTNESQVDFHLSVTSQSENSNEKKAGVIKVVEAGIGNTNKLSHEAVNRVSFSVPFFPQAISG